MGTSFREWVSQNRNQYGRRSSSFGPGGPSKAKKPKSHPPRSFRDRLGILHGSLPEYSGPYSVGFMDIEVPVRQPRNMSNITRKGEHILKLDTVLMTIFYPASSSAGTGRDPSGKKRWSRATWIPRPRFSTAKSYGALGGAPAILAVPFFAATTMFTKIPAFRNPPPARCWPKRATAAKADPNGHARSESLFEEDDPEPCFPLMFFSHGLEGTRTAYSAICGEFASYGFVVCAIEHRDGSGPTTRVNYHNDPDESTEDIETKDGEGSKSKRTPKAWARRVDYIWPKNNPYDTSPGNEQGFDEPLRRNQIELRLAEIEEAHYVLKQIAEGHGDSIAQHNLRQKGYAGASSRGLEGVDWSLWKHRFDTNDITMAGHSFGGVTTVSALRKADRFHYISQGIILDIWGAPVTEDPRDSENPVRIPLLSIGTEAFALWEKNLKTILYLMEEAKSQGAPAWFLTIRGTVHLSQSDFALLYPHTLAFFLKMAANPKRSLELNTEASLEFLCSVMPKRHLKVLARSIATANDPILEMALIEGVPDDHMPNVEYLAERLGHIHPFKDYVMPAVERKVRRAKNVNTVERGDELWMHVSSTADEVQAYKERVMCRNDQDVEPMALDILEDTKEDATANGKPEQTEKT